ncbi:hypothetical protein [Desulfurococcus amylolyticus]|nr:hypothetical protein [Desulfurococcus amylolyticus]
MNGVSEVFSTILLTSIFLALVFILLPFSYYTIMGSVAKTEYEYVKHGFYSIAAYFPMIATGGEYSIDFPSQYTSRGYIEIGRIDIYLNSSSQPTLSFSCTALTQGANVGGAPRGLLYGVDTHIVNDSRMIPRIYEYRDGNGLMIITLDTCRLLLDVNTIPTGNYSGYYYILTYYNLTINFRGSGSLRIEPVRTYTAYSNIGGNLWNITIVVSDYILGKSSSYNVIDLVKTGFGKEYAGIPFSLTIVVEELVVEV